MGYSEGKNRIKSYVMPDGKIIKLLPGRSNEKENYRELHELGNGKRLAIRYPGRKTEDRKCDYCVYLVDEDNQRPITHEAIMWDLYNKTHEDNFLYIKKYIEDVAELGRDVNPDDYPGIRFEEGFDFEELTGLMFYIAIQEDINYPYKNCQGRKMCFNRYIEVAYCKVYGNHKIEEAVARAKDDKIPDNWKDAGDLYDKISSIQR